MSIDIVGDESGSEGENLSAASHQFFTYGTSALSHAEAADVVARTRQAIGSTMTDIHESRELKSAQLIKRHRSVVESLFSDGGPISESSSIYLVDKTKFLAGKMVSLLIEEHQHGIGNTLGPETEGLLANELHDVALPALGPRERARLLSTFNVLSRSYKTSYGPEGRAHAFVAALRDAMLSLDHGPAVVALSRLWFSRAEAYVIEKSSGEEGMRTYDLEPMLPAMLVVAATWHQRLKGSSFRIVMDEYAQFTPDMGLWVTRVANDMFKIPLKDVVQVVSREDPRVQVADWIAGVGRVAVTEVSRGDINALTDAMRPLIDGQSMYSLKSPIAAWLHPELFA
ncbi:DUF3800 domain-containing protein [Clavibacter capsici]|uniref:DUF3800 domain-containing protein n=1 Tax=Clavibacter capsici TaxID=1874630 RepID=UPI00142867BB|nr:DUF3800 domain-containing protein [Clavibacter capsici]QIS39553.1 DUF3800 domain-containing protein [Clavibacter capsici]